MADGAALPALPPDLPDIAAARLPMAYANAKHALRQCYRLDECKSWADKAEAIASYAKQAHDNDLRVWADRIKRRALRRCGQLLKDIPSATGAHLKNDATDTLSRKTVASAAGLSERQRITAIRVAAVPAEKFEEAVEREKPATLTELAEMGRQARPDARADGIADAEAGTREHADRWPPGTAGHADYELGHQEVEQRGERTPQDAADALAAARLLNLLGHCNAAIVMIDVAAARRGLSAGGRAQAEEQITRILYWLGALDV